MRLADALELMNEFAMCKDCGSESIGNGAGTLDISGNTFIRTCACGWKVNIDKDSDSRMEGGKQLG